MICRLNQPGLAAPLFGDWPETILWSCLEGVMGEVWGDDHDRPRSAMAHLGDFCFFAGAPDRELAGFRPPEHRKPYALLIPQNDAWAACIEEIYGTRVRRFTRYATKKEPSFSPERLRVLADSLPNPYTIRNIDRKLYDQCSKMEWSRDLLGQFSSWEQFCHLGLGFCVLLGEEPVSGASSFSRYREGIEIEIDTRPDHQRRGLARACGARLILECLDRGLYPSWDAHTAASLALAEQLGYRLDHPYTAFEITDC